MESEHPEVRTALESLLEAVTRHGAIIHPALRVVERDSDISVHAEAPVGAALVDLPEALFVPLRGARWEAVGDRFVVLQHGLNATPAQREIAEALASVYNSTGKLTWTRTCHPLAVFDGDTDVVGALRSLRPSLFHGAPSPVDRFLASRLYVHDGAPYLLPVVELLNSVRSGSPLDVLNGSMTIKVSRPADVSTECFVCYGPRRDAIDLALVFGYLDREVPFARSVPLVVEVDRVGTVEIIGRRITPRSAIDPPSISITAGRLTLSHHTFNAEEPQYLAATLRLAVEGLLRHTQSDLDPEVAVRDVARAIVLFNLERLAAAAGLLADRRGTAADIVRSALECQRLTILRASAQTL